MFYRLCTQGHIPVSRITRTDAWQQGCPVFHPITRQPITPDQARNLAQNKRAYDQNYQCAFEDQNMALLTHELISAAERPNLAIICEQNWTEHALTLLKVGPAVPSGPRAFQPIPIHQPASSVHLAPSENPQSSIVNHQSSINGRLPTASARQSDDHHQSPIIDHQSSITPLPSAQSQISNLKSQIPPLLFAGVDVARHHDQTVITLLERNGSTYLVRAILRLRDMRLPDQQQRLETILSLPNLKHLKIDMTGLGLGLFEYTQQKFPNKISGLNFSSTIDLDSSSPLRASAPLWLNNRSSLSIRITEHLATKLLQAFEDRALQIPIDSDLRDDLRKPERLVSPSGRVSIAATRDDAGHADHFWSLALALDAAQTPVRPPPASAPVHIPGRLLGRAPRRHNPYRD